MLEVIYVSKSSKKLITGQKYVVVSLWEDVVWKNKSSISHNGKLVPRRKVRLKGGYAYYIENFKTIDGKSFYDIPVFGNKIYHYNENAVKPNNKDYTGQYVLCREERNRKYLKSGEIYYVEEHKKIPITTYGANFIKHTFKFVGLKNYVNAWLFDEISIKDQRRLKLKSVAGEEITSGLTKRKFLYFSNIKKHRILVELYLRSLKNLENVKNLQGITIIDVMISLGQKYDINEDDVKLFIDKSLSLVLKDLGFL